MCDPKEVPATELGYQRLFSKLVFQLIADHCKKDQVKPVKITERFHMGFGQKIQNKRG